MKYYFAQILASALAISTAWPGALAQAQEAIDLPGSVTPEAVSPEATTPAMPDPARSNGAFQYGAAAAASDADGAIEPFIPGSNVREFSCDPALLESSGTWLERGFWYGQADVLILNRTWERKGLYLGFETNGVNGNATGDPGNINARTVGTANFLNIDGNKPGADMAFRLTLGRFLFRDGDNRDHTTEFSWLGDGHWSQEGAFDAVSNGSGIRVNNIIDRDVNTSFDGAQAMRFLYDSHLDSLEWNYHVKQRMGRDRMELQPNGQWIRKATSTTTFSYLAGLRFINHREALDWDATGIPDANGGADVDGNYFVTTDNNLLGTQLGGSVAHQSDRWSLELLGKIGGYWNAMDRNSQFNVGTLVSNQEGQDEDNLSAVGEVMLTGRWHLRPNFSIRAGMELLWIDSIALAPHQLNFVPNSNLPIAETGDSVYMGTTIGFEGYW